MNQNLNNSRIIDLLQKAHMVVSELGIQPMILFKPETISSLAELIQYYIQRKGKDPELSDIRKWQEEIKLGLKFEFIAKKLEKIE
jgi:hypothetical protein